VPYIVTPRLRMYYERVGAGPRLLCVSGSGQRLDERPNLLDAPLAGHFDTAIHDQRGLGRTDTPDGDYSMADYADDAAALLDALGWADCRVLGVSFGGMVAQELALRHPARVRRLVLACTSSGGAGGSSYPLHDIVDLPAEERARIQVERYDTRGLAPDLARLVAARAAAPLTAGARKQIAARRGHDTADRLGALRLPVLVCGGRFDGIAPVANQEALAALIPGARLELFDGGHLFLIQDRAAYPAVIDFLRRG
jgi:3-oxoadipate enol-lactonase